MLFQRVQLAIVQGLVKGLAIPFLEKKKKECEKCSECSCSVKSNDCVSSTTQITSTAGLPCHLRDLYKRSTTDLTAEEAKQLFNLLLEFADVFSEGPHDLGRTDLVKHKIDTEGAAPIQQQPRRLPFAKQAEAEKAVNEMYEQAIIEPVPSPCGSH